MTEFKAIDLGTDQITLGVDDHGVALVTLNRPEQLNALSQALIAGLTKALKYAAAEDSVMAVVLTGKGKAFSAGVDLKELTVDASIMDADQAGVDATITKAFSQCTKPIVGAINGFAVTGGLEVALFCDFLCAAESAKFADTHARVGLLPGWGLSQKLPRLVGINRARELSFTGNYFSAEQACEWGLVNKVLPDDQLLEAAIETARQIASTVPEALVRIRAMMNEGWDMPLGDALVMEGGRAGAYNSAMDLTKMDERLASLQKRAKK